MKNREKRRFFGILDYSSVTMHILHVADSK